ncbi:MAG: WxL domain-containing protein [Kurthia sp.]|nr:WxL domain-containing protein [Candidatus Kurthia equi]
MIILSMSLVVSSGAPFLANTKASAKANTTEVPETAATMEDSTIEYLTLEMDGSGQVEIDKDTKEISLELEKQSKLKNKQVEMSLPKGFSYEGNEENIDFDKEKNKLAIEMEEEKQQFKLTVDIEKMESKTAILTATLDDGKDSLTSNDYKVNVVEQETVSKDSTKAETKSDTPDEKATIKEEEETTDSPTATPSNRDTKATEETSTPKNEEPSKTKKGTKTNGNGMTTVEGVPNAPSPAVQSVANPEATNEVDVDNWADFDKAMRDKTINIINIQADFYNPTLASAAAEHNVLVPMREITINGNGHIVDFKNYSYYNNNPLARDQVVEWEINHLTMYGRNFYGPIKTASSATNQGAYGAMVYDSVTYIGAQLTASYYWTIDFAGQVENHSKNSYVSPFDDVVYNAQTNQTNIEATDMVFRENSYYNGTTTNAGVFYLQNSGAMTLEENADVTLTSNGATGEGGAYGVYLQGLVKAGKNSSLTVNGSKTGNQYGIYIAGSGNGIHAEDGSKVNINTNTTYPSIVMQANTSVIVEDDAELSVDAKSKGATTLDVINAPYANTTLIIGKKGTFNLASDGSGNHYLLNLGTNAIFQFADAENVNLQFTNNNLSTNARLIYMSGSNGQLDVDVQDVKAWNRTDIANNGTREADYHWTPMFGMVTKFSGANGTVQSASSVMNSEREKYTAEFKPQNFSRILYNYIEDVETGILNPLTDNVTSVDSTVVKGVANPGAYVRLTGDPALPEATIPSIVDGADEPELTDDFTVIADEKGEFEVKAKEGQHFTASNNIKAFAFLGGKMAEDTVKVLDETAPTGESINLAMVYGEDLPEAKQYIINPQDTNPANEGYTYEYKEDYTALATEEGIHDVTIVLGDEAGNKAEIPAKLEVTKDGYGIKSNDFSVALSDLKQYDTNAKMKEYVLSESQASAYGIIDNEFVDLSENLVVDDLGNIEQMKAGKYEIQISFDLSSSKPEAKATGQFTVTVLNDEAVKPTNPENPGAGEPEEVENGGTGQTGLLKLDYAPSAFDFGQVKFGFDSVTTNAVKTTSDKQWVQVSDNRAEEDITDWSVQVVQDHALATENGDELKGATITVPKGKVYNEETGDQEVTTGQLVSQKVAITTTPETVFSTNNAIEQVKNTSTNVWQATDVSLAIPGGQEVEFEDYSNTLTWSLVAEPKE